MLQISYQQNQTKLFKKIKKNITSTKLSNHIFSHSPTPSQMGKKMKFPFLFRSTETTSSTAAAAAWPWPACVNNPKTLSFRADAADGGHNNIYKTMNSAYLDDDDGNTTTTESADINPDSHFTILDYLKAESVSAAAAEHPGSNDDDTAVVGGMRSDRLFFEPGETSSILEEAKKAYDGGFPYKDQSVAIVAVDSVDPYLDFRVSMEEMVAAHGLKDWTCLEELLTCFLRVNVKANHGYIVGAFVDLLLHLSLTSDNNNNDAVSAIDERCSSSSTTTQHSFTSPLSFSSSTYSSNYSPFLSLMENEDENQIIVDKNVKTPSSSSSSSSS